MVLGILLILGQIELLMNLRKIRTFWKYIESQSDLFYSQIIFRNFNNTGKQLVLDRVWGEALASTCVRAFSIINYKSSNFNLEFNPSLIFLRCLLLKLLMYFSVERIESCPKLFCKSWRLTGTLILFWIIHLPILVYTFQFCLYPN